uniref:Cation-transporting P-type ATPase C-terminal domain-containing protein n=1 Tax=Pycnococcus provasolii TaxID=41880 RepID=A0A7S2AMK5_9CHLO
MWCNIVVQAIFQLTVLGYMYFVLFKGDHGKHANTFVFNTFVFMQLFNEINARRPDALNVFDGFWKNRYFVSVLLVTVLFQILLVESTFGTVVGTTSLTNREWLTSVAVGALALPIAALGKLAWRL